MADEPEVEQLRKLLFEFEEGPVWPYVRDEMQRVHDQDVTLLLQGTDKDDRVRGGIAVTQDLLKIPDRIREEIDRLDGKEIA